MINIQEYPEAEKVFRFFEEISKIPHGSGNTAKIADYLVTFAKERGLFVYRDGVDNVVIKKGATSGYESRPTVIIQGHTDMVAEKLPNLDKDMQTEGLLIYRDGDFLRAKGTTLGGDDGVAVAYALAILDSDDIAHPAIEALFTSDEETGLIGASALDTSVLDGKIMINVDSDDEGVFTVGCAGGARVDIKIPVSFSTSENQGYTLKVCGLTGGHSGIEIGNGRENAIKIGADILRELGDIRISALFGGNMDNAIPREFDASFTASADISAKFDCLSKKLTALYREHEPEINISLAKTEGASQALDIATSKRITDMLAAIPTGVIAMSRDIEGLVESSQNIGIIRLGADNFELTVSVRSSVGEKKSSLISAISDAAGQFDASVAVRGEYPAWEYKKDSHLRDVCCEVFKDTYGREANVITIHAGLECGIFSNKIEGLDCISIGPDNFDIHTTEEHLSISSTARVFDFIKRVLAKI